MVERILRGLKPLLLLLQAPSGGHKPSVEVISFEACFRDDECVIVRTVLLSQGSLMSSSLGITVIGRLLWAVFSVTWLILLHGWVHMVVVAFGVDWGVDLSSAIIAVFTVT